MHKRSFSARIAALLCTAVLGCTALSGCVVESVIGPSSAAVTGSV